MARGTERDSATSQFYISVNDVVNSYLDGDYAVFGKVISGNNIYKSINNVETDGDDWPVTNVVIRKAYMWTG